MDHAKVPVTKTAQFTVDNMDNPAIALYTFPLVS